MPQTLTLINKGDRHAPATYQFGRNEHLNIHQDNYADLTDATTGCFIRTLDWNDILNMGYSPAKLLNGNQVDQLIDSPYRDLLISTKSYVKHIVSGLAIGFMAAVISNATGCTNLVLDQLEQDISTSTIEPRASLTGAQLLEFQAQNAHANKQLRAMNLYAAGDAK